MSHKRGQKQYLSNVYIEDQEVVKAGLETPDASVTIKREIPLIQTMKVTLAAVATTITDTGGANGGYGTEALMTLPARRIMVLGGVLDFGVVAAAGIGATGDVKASIGTAAEATNDTLDSVQASIVPSTAVTLAASIGDIQGGSTSTETPLIIDATAGTVKLYLNFGIADADLSSASTVTSTGTLWLHYIDMGDQ